MGDSKLYKGSLATIILNLLTEADKMYGYEITQKVKKLDYNYRGSLVPDPA